MTDITVHCVVKNEEKWVWYALNSVKEIAQKIIVFDTGSTDNTVKIIKTIKSDKIHLHQKGSVNATGLTKLREEQLKMTDTNWALILDGDEIWTHAALDELENKLNRTSEDLYGGVIRAWNAVGDVYHYHPESIKYHWPYAPKKYHGWANLRLINTKINGLHLKGEYPQEAYCDQKGIPIQNYGPRKLFFIKNRYFHTTYLVRSSSRKVDKNILNRAKKGKPEIGTPFSKKFSYPEVFYLKRPSIVQSPWEKRSKKEKFLSRIISPIKELRRNIFNLYNPK
jgi:glycosyltransferase involved in cell wall biosynthesis